MDLSFLRPLYARPGPFASAYLEATGDGDEQGTPFAGWERLRERLVAEGADVATMGALAHAVPQDDSDVSGRGLALFAAHGRLALAEPLSQAPGEDRAAVAFVPDAMPLALQRAPDIACTAIQLRRVHEPGGMSRLIAETQSGRWPHIRVAPPEPDVRHVPAGEWRQAARALADELVATAERNRTEVVVLAGDRWAGSVLLESLPEHDRERVVRIDAVTTPASPGRLLLEGELEYLVGGRLSAGDRRHVDGFLEERARNGAAVEGLDATAQALRRAAVAALIVDTPTRLDRERLWVGAVTRQLAVAREELEPLRASACWSAPADAALLRALVGEGGELVAVRREELPLMDGIGALLHERSPGRAA
ncbi:baeRF2 domain-containing protein [Streptacidiphilus rugosus]|uniref:baeRF2 domain-containing protein n=1 Tax=Streptacidiphilus rugosus TaxID=405783 RepID=UPI000563E17F|nr:hypothetical protein [Streptacidiphilus rugosus]